jgi:hypothetical protein
MVSFSRINGMLYLPLPYLFALLGGKKFPVLALFDVPSDGPK